MQKSRGDNDWLMIPAPRMIIIGIGKMLSSKLRRSRRMKLAQRFELI